MTPAARRRHEGAVPLTRARRTTGGSRRLLAWALGLACTSPPSPLPPRGVAPGAIPSPPETRLAQAPPKPPLRSCQEVGPRACDLPPATPADVCARAGPCVREHPPHGGLLDELNIDCELPSSEAIEAAFTARAPAPELAGLRGTSVIHVVAGAEMILFGATYLVAEFEEGSCLVDTVLEWERRIGYFDTDFQTRWEPAAGGFRLYVDGHRVTHEPIDRAVEEEDMSDVTSDYCDRSVYEVVNGHFTRLSHESAPGTCERSPND